MIREYWKPMLCVAGGLAVLMFSMAPTSNFGNLKGHTVKVFDTATVAGVGGNAWGGTQTISGADRFGIGYMMDEATSTGHIDIKFEISFDGTNWIAGQYMFAVDYQTDATWEYAELDGTSTKAPYLRFKATGVTSNADGTQLTLYSMQQ